MNFADFLQSRNGIVAIGVLVVAVLGVVSLLVNTEGGEHPLALESDVDLCGALGEDIWAQLHYPASDPVARVPATAESDVLVCALELDPVPPGDRWARVARGDDADATRRIATITLTTTANLRQQNPEGDTEDYTRSFDEELVANGWSGREIEGPWAWGSVYTTGEEKAATLVEDDGIVLWTTSEVVTPDNLVAFTRSASRRIRVAE